MVYLDLFSGIGGFSEGFKRAGWKFSKHYFSEINKYAIKIYQRHFPDAIPLGSITEIRPEELGQVDLITFGFPCQDLSIAGKRAGLEGSRSGLFFEATRLIRYLKPSIFIFENVAGLLTSNDGKDFEVVLREIADIGIYECEWQLLNTSWFLPQNRERVYFIGYSPEAGRCRRKVFPIGTECEQIDKPNGGGGQSAQTVTARYQAATSQGSYVVECDKVSESGIAQLNDQKHSNDRVYGQVGLLIREATKQGYAIAKDGDSINLSNPNSKTRRGRVGGGMANTLDTQMQQHTLQGSRIRRLTEVECERLQGFQDGWTEGVSSSQRYRALGNAVSVPIVEYIAKRLMEAKCGTK